MVRRLLIAGLLAAGAALGAGSAAQAGQPEVIARDGTAITFPEATLAAFDLAILQGADSLRVDVYQTFDGVLVIRTDRNLAATTNAASVLTPPGPIKGEPAPVGFPIDFTTYQDYARLTARQTIPGRDNSFDGMFSAPILEDLLVLVERRQSERRRTIGLLIVLHDTQVHAARGRPMEPRLISTLQKYGFAASPDVLIGSSEPSSFARLGGLQGRRVFVLGTPSSRPADAAQTGDRRSFADYATADGLRTVRNFADAVLVDVQDTLGGLGEGAPVPALVGNAKAAGLMLFVGGFADADNPVLPRRAAIAAYHRAFNLGADAVVTDEPARALAARRNGR